MSDPQALHVTRNVIPGKLGVDLHLHRVHIPLVPIALMDSMYRHGFGLNICLHSAFMNPCNLAMLYLSCHDVFVLCKR